MTNVEILRRKNVTPERENLSDSLCYHLRELKCKQQVLGVNHAAQLELSQ